MYFFETIVNAVQLKDKVMPESCKYVPLPGVFVFIINQPQYLVFFTMSYFLLSTEFQ